MALLLRLFEPDRGASRSTASTCAASRSRACGARSRWRSRRTCCSAPRSARTSATPCGDASDAAVREAARVACADEFIERQEQGYDTPLGERGTKLSTGQRQRLSIARAVLKDAPILVLDEPTASLDAETELRVLRNLAALGRGPPDLPDHPPPLDDPPGRPDPGARAGAASSRAGSHDELLAREGGAVPPARGARDGRGSRAAGRDGRARREAASRRARRDRPLRRRFRILARALALPRALPRALRREAGAAAGLAAAAPGAALAGEDHRRPRDRRRARRSRRPRPTRRSSRPSSGSSRACSRPGSCSRCSGFQLVLVVLLGAVGHRRRRARPGRRLPLERPRPRHADRERGQRGLQHGERPARPARLPLHACGSRRT